MKELWFKWRCFCHIAILATHVNVKWIYWRHAAYVLLAANIAIEKRLHSLSLLDHICLRSSQTHQFDPTSQCQDKPRNKLKGFNHCFSLVKRVCSYKREAQECSTLRLPQLSGKYDQPSKCWNPCQRTNMTQEARELMLPTAYWIPLVQKQASNRSKSRNQSIWHT